MKRKLSALILANILILLFSIQVVYAKKSETEFFFNGEKSLYMRTRSMLYGGGFKFFLSSKSFYLDIHGAFAEKKASSGIEKFNKNRFGIELENSLKCFTFDLSYNIYREKTRLFPFGQPKEIIILEKWNRSELIGGLGVKIGRYDKSYIHVVGLIGRSYYKNIDNLVFLDMILEKDNSKETIIGGKIGIRLDACLESKWGRPHVVIPFWIDFQSGYKYYLGSKEYEIGATLGLGIKIIKHLGIKGSIAGIRSRDKRSKLINYYAGLVLVF